MPRDGDPSSRQGSSRYAKMDGDEFRRGREETTISIRKDKKQEQLQKRRDMRTTPGAGATPPGGMPGPEHPTVGSQAWQEANPQQLVDGVHSEDPNAQLPAVTQFRKLLSIERSPPIEEVIAAGVVPRFVQFLQCGDNPMLQFESAWALTNIASGTSEHTRVVIANGAVPIFVQLLLSPNDDVREQAVWALGNIAGDSPECRDLVLTHGALQPLLEQLNPNSKMSMLRNATWTLSNLCRGKPQPNWQLVAPALSVLAQLIFSNDDEVPRNSLRANSAQFSARNSAQFSTAPPRARRSPLRLPLSPGARRRVLGALVPLGRSEREDPGGARHGDLRARRRADGPPAGVGADAGAADGGEHRHRRRPPDAVRAQLRRAAAAARAAAVAEEGDPQGGVLDDLQHYSGRPRSNPGQKTKNFLSCPTRIPFPILTPDGWVLRPPSMPM